MIQNLDQFDDVDRRVIDYSDPAEEPHDVAPRYRRNDSGGFVAAGIAVAMVLIGGFIYAGYLTENITIVPRQVAQQHTGTSTPIASTSKTAQK